MTVNQIRQRLKNLLLSTFLSGFLQIWPFINLPLMVTDQIQQIGRGKRRPGTSNWVSTNRIAYSRIKPQPQANNYWLTIWHLLHNVWHFAITSMAFQVYAENPQKSGWIQGDGSSGYANSYFGFFAFNAIIKNTQCINVAQNMSRLLISKDKMSGRNSLSRD